MCRAVRRSFFLAVALALTGVPAAAAGSPTSTGREVAHHGSWRAEFTYLKSTGARPFARLHLRVLDGSKVVLDGPVASSLQGASQLQPGRFAGRPSISFRDLDGDGTPELLLALFTGGAHCCFLEQVFDLRTLPPRKSELGLADAGARVVRVDGRTLLESADEAFAYEFTDFADSGAPVVLWRYAGGRFSDATRSYPRVVAADAAGWWRAYLQQAKRKGDVRGLLAAWAADEALLGHAASAKETLLRLASGGRIEVANAGGARGRAYVATLWRFLAKEHYLR